jgi:uncharacterized membrane protein/Mg-chelatase subunit ChlD
MILAIAGLQWVRISDKVTVIYLLDQSDSIARAKRDQMLDLAIRSVREHRNDARGDRAGMIVFGREAAIEFPPYDDDLPAVRGLESYLGATDATNLESALKLAQASFPEDTAKRVVIISDGAETIGQAATVAKSMADSGIGIDVVPVDLMTKSEVLVEKIALPANIRQGQPFETRIVIHRYQPQSDTPVAGRLRLLRTVGSTEQVLLDDSITLDKEVNVFPITDTISQPAGYTYRAEFIPDRTEDDALQQNNRVESFTYVRGKGRVLLIENWRSPGQHTQLVEALRSSEIETDVMSSNALFISLAELQAYDSVILAGVPRTSGEQADDVAGFTDEQIEMLVANTEQFGCGLLMLGSKDSFGAGGWSNSGIEKAMPVDFQIKNNKLEAVGALAMVMHASEIASGNHWQKKIAEEALKILGPMDYCGVLEFSELGDRWLWGAKDGMLRVGPNRAAMRQRLSSLTPQDMPDFQPSMQLAIRSLRVVPAAIKHMIIISDGDPTPPTQGLLDEFAAAKVKISTVAVGSHGPAGSQTLEEIAERTGGTYYEAVNASALPRIFQREAMRVTQPLIREPEGGFAPQITFPHEVLTGLPRDLPRTLGYVLTTVKDSGLVEVTMRAGEANIDAENQTILATWTYGLGRTGVFTSDAGRRWTNAWTQWDGYKQFWTQLVRWSMRPSESDSQFSIATSAGDGQVQVVVNGLDSDNNFLNFLDMQAVAVGPDLKPLPISMRQVAPGRYVGNFHAQASGSYLVNVIPGPGMAPLTTGANVPYSDEYRLRKTKYEVLEQLASLEPQGGASGNLTPALEAGNMQQLLENNVYRAGLPRAMSLADLWPLCVLIGAVCLFGDIFVRRVALDYAWPMKWLYAKWFRPATSSQDAQRQASLKRLRARKSEVGAEVDSSMAGARFDPQSTSAAASLADLDTEVTRGKPASKATAAPAMSTEDPQQGYTSRLLAAKKAAQQKKGEE